MKHIYAVQRPEAEIRTRRRISVAEINILRKFEGRTQIEDRIARQMTKLHSLWFRNRVAQQ
jgi:hypothetical protein